MSESVQMRPINPHYPDKNLFDPVAYLKELPKRIRSPHLNFTDFQIARCEEIMKREGFDFFIGPGVHPLKGSLIDVGEESRDKRGPFTILWYEKDGELYAQKIGKVRCLTPVINSKKETK